MILPAELEQENTAIAAREWQLYNSRKEELATTIEILEEQAKQRRQDIAELEEKLTEVTRTYQLLKREIELTEPLNVPGGQFIDAARFPQLDAVRRDHHTLRDGFIADRDFAVVVGTNTVDCKRVLTKTHAEKIRRPAESGK